MTTSLPRRICEAVIASPGITQRELASVVDAEPSRVATAVVWLLRNGKLRQDGTPNPAVRKLHPTAETMVDRRQQRIRGERKPRREPKAKPAARPGATAARIVQARDARVLPPPPAGAQSVEEFLAKGGAVQRLGPYESGNPLRFDHSRTDVPAARRRPTVRARKAAT